MTIDECRKALSAIPSQPFIVRLADGATHCRSAVRLRVVHRRRPHRDHFPQEDDWFTIESFSLGLCGY